MPNKKYYSKLHIKGLPTPKEIVIRSLADYMKLLSSEKLENYIYRGEPTNYNNIISSALRDGEYPYIKMKNDFKRKIYHRLSADERKDFLAFAQHHGLPTNLIDFTHSPLVALYFACQPFSSKDTRYDQVRGFIYLIRNDLIDITDMLDGHEDENFLLRLIQSENEFLFKLYEKIFLYEKQFPESFHYYFKKLCDDWKYYIIDMQPSTPKRSRFPKYDNGEYRWKIKYTYCSKKSDLIKSIEQKHGNIELVVLEYILMLKEFLNKAVEYEATVWWLNCIPPFLYTPFLSFERGRNQQGLFVYQAHMSYEETIYGTHILSQQRVWPEIVIVVENKEKILADLDLIGVNEKFIYGDFDNIAKYIKNQYQ